MKLLPYLLVPLLFAAACSPSTETEEIIPFEISNLSKSEKLKKALELDYVLSMGLSEEDHQYLRSFYAGQQFKPLWMNDSMLTVMGTKMADLLQTPEKLGIPSGRNQRTKGQNFVQAELLNTLYLSRIVYDLKVGTIDLEKKVKRPVLSVPVKELNQFTHFDEQTDLREQFLAFGPNDSTYRVLGKGLIAMYDNYPMDSTKFHVETIKKDTLKAISETTKALISKGYLTIENDSLALMEAIKVFQMHNGLKPDGVIGKYTAMALNESTVHKRDRVILGMEKLRAHAPYPEKRICINIPEYMLRFYIGDSLKSEHHIVAGKYENQTPELTSKLNKIVAYPYWNVPYSISSKEILPAVKQNSGYLQKHNYKIYKKGELVDPATVNWSKIRENNFPYKVVQDPGKSNSLGIIKFDFPNAHSVYFHDTPSKSLFSADVRAYSHGCMRTQNPVDLARKIIERDQLPMKENELIVDSLDSIMAREKNYTIRLLDPIPIFVEYQTVTRKANDMVIHIDIYGRDEEYLKIMRN